jgi:imidazole glycerol phosphate synthase subunit HisF
MSTVTVTELKAIFKAATETANEILLKSVEADGIAEELDMQVTEAFQAVKIAEKALEARKVEAMHEINDLLASFTK